MNEKNPKFRSTKPKILDTKVEKVGRKAVKTIFSTVLTTVLSIFIILIITAGTIAGAMAVYVNNCMDENSGIDLEQEKMTLNQTSIVYIPGGEDGTELQEIHRFVGTENRIWAELDEVPLDLRNAFVSIEDERFYTHSGVDWKRTLGALANSFGGSVYNSTQGGSTITQQLVKNITSDNEVTFVRKINEIFSALALTKETTKDEVLTAYLNTVYLGSGTYGVNTAAEKYFGKTVSELNTAECAIIASITQSPDKYNPLKNPSETKKRQEYCLSKMLELEYINEKEYEEAKNYKLIYTNSMEYLYSEDEEEDEEEEDEDARYQSYYIDTLFRQIRNDLCSEYGLSTQEAEYKIYNGGLKIVCAIDMEAQDIVDETFENYIGFLREENQAIKSQAAITIMDYSGRVIAISGGAGEKIGNLCLNRATSSPRQPGSSIKPVTVYAPAIEMNAVTWGTAIKDEPSIEVEGKPWPSNYSHTYSMGPVSVQNALERSLNTIPVKIVKDLGIGTCFEFAQEKMHLSTLVESGTINDQTYSSLCVGGMTKGVTTWDMTAAFATFGNGGLYYEPYTYYEVRNNQDQILLEYDDHPEQVISEQTSFIMNKMMQTVITGSSGTGRGYGIPNQTVFAKTGTTTNVYDRYFAGGTPHYVASVWYGYDIPKQLTMATNPAGDVWKVIMNQLHEGLNSGSFPTCTGVQELRYCLQTGKIASATCTNCATGWFKTDYTGGYCEGNHYYVPPAGTGSGGGDAGNGDGDAGGETPDVQPPVEE